MKISEQEVSRLLSYAPIGRSGNASTGSWPESAAHISGRGDGVRISSIAQDIQRVTRALDRLPDVRENRVRALKTQIDNGAYNVSSENIADLIIRRALADATAI